MGIKKATFVTPFGGILRRLRNEVGYTQEGLGSMLRPDVCISTARQYIFQLEAGKKLPCVEDIKRLAEIFKVEPETLETTVSDYSSMVYVKVRERREAPPQPKVPTIVGSTLYHMAPEKFAATVNGILNRKIQYVPMTEGKG